ncbi:MAG: hypothetical protein A2189_07460 [Paenibacillus sp. RIFOXYA1_FULL_44_5]|nr:MAG: hypothetical protein A2189_07460 [Paenibacillus sp. RIFOXYA1_FULL_44_5]
MHGTEIIPGVWIGENVKIGHNITLNGPSYIGESCELADDVQIGAYTVAGRGSSLQKGVSIERSVVWQNNTLKQHVELKGTVLGSSVTVLAGASVREESVIGDHCVIGKKCVVKEGVKIWPNKQLDHHSIINESIIWTEKQQKSLFGEMGVKGICNVDLTTSYVHRLALAYASTIKVGVKIGIGHDGTPYSQLLAHMFMTAMHASGVHTYDLGSGMTAITRYAVNHYHLEGAVHVRQISVEGEHWQLEFVDAKGLPIAKAQERKIENAYFQESFRRVSPKDLGYVKKAHQIMTHYMDRLASFVNSGAIHRKKYRVVVEYENQNLRSIVPMLFDRLGCQLIQLPGTHHSQEQLPAFMKDNHADLGVRLNDNGEIEMLVTEEGQVLDEVTLILLHIFMQVNLHDGEIRVPSSAPHYADWIGEKYGRKVVRLKMDPRSLMEGCSNHGFHLYSDGLYTITQILHMMSLQHCGFSQLVETDPGFSMCKKNVSCPWTEKGKIMRTLLEESRNHRVELIDGIKIFHEAEAGWSLIIPDSEEPLFRVLASANNSETAEKLALMYTKKIEHYLNAHIIVQ